jgi:DNA-binding transcriptional MerR regulator
MTATSEECGKINRHLKNYKIFTMDNNELIAILKDKKIVHFQLHAIRVILKSNSIT